MFGFLALLSLGLLRLVWLGDTSFVNDEGQLFAAALKANAEGVWVDHGLQGSRGVVYGPFAIWFYQIALAWFHSPMAIAALKTGVCTLGTAVGVTILLRTFSFLPFWAGAAVFLSPYYWLYARDLWDNSFLIPLVALAAAGHFRFLQGPSLTRFAWLVLCGSFCFLTHLMVLPLLAAIAVQGVWVQGRWLRKNFWGVLFILVLAAVFVWPYVHYLATHPATQASWLGPKFRSFVFSLLGARVFTAMALEYFLGWAWYLELPAPVGYFVAAAIGITALAVISSFVGMRRAWQARGESGAPGQLAGFLALALGFHCVLLTGTQLVSHPHYYSGLWIVFFLLAAWGASGQWGRKLSGLYLGSLAVSLVAMVGLLHIQGGNRELHHGMSLRLQWEAAHLLACYPPEALGEDLRENSFVEPLRLLRARAVCKGAPQAGRPRIRYAFPDRRRDAHFVVEPAN